VAGNRSKQRLPRLLKEDLENRVLDFDSAAATEAASLAATRRKEEGRPVDMRDTQIAGMALARRAALATQNVLQFLDLEISMVNPSRD
jgi:predicted nucleic acid-binding protein